MMINKIMKDEEISEQKANRMFHYYTIKRITDKKKKTIKYLDRIKEKYIEKYFSGMIDDIFDKWIEEGRPIEVTEYEKEKYEEDDRWTQL